MRIVILGANGKVARQCVQHLLLAGSVADWELILVSRNSDRIRGMVADIVSTTALLRRIPCRSPTVLPTTDFASMKGADLVVLAAAVWPPPEIAEALRSADPSGRTVQSRGNFRLVQELGRQIAKHAPNAAAIVVTNQSDLMTMATREVLEPARVLGMGGMIDSSRFRTLAARIVAPAERDLVRHAHMVGYHNHDMRLLSASFPCTLTGSALDILVEETRAYGGMVSSLQRDRAQPQLDSGASVLPGYALYLAIAAFSGQIEPLDESFNVILPSAAAQRYGTVSNHALSVPIRVKHRAWSIASNHNATQAERSLLLQAQERLEAEYGALRACE